MLYSVMKLGTWCKCIDILELSQEPESCGAISYLVWGVIAGLCLLGAIVKTEEWVKREKWEKVWDEKNGQNMI